MKPSPLSNRARLISGTEFLFGTALVIGHNVFRVVPNEVLILCLIGLLSLRLRSGTWAAVGFKQPQSWRNIVLFALVAAALRIALGEVIESVGSQYWPAIVAPSGSDEIVGNIKMALVALVIVWTFAAFGEEIAYRGYLLTRAAELLGDSARAWWLGVIIVSVLFGLGHYYKGPVGMIDSSVSGLILGAAYMLSGRNLWVCVLAHGFINTIAIIFVYFGLDVS